MTEILAALFSTPLALSLRINSLDRLYSKEDFKGARLTTVVETTKEFMN